MRCYLFITTFMLAACGVSDSKTVPVIISSHASTDADSAESPDAGADAFEPDPGGGCGAGLRACGGTCVDIESNSSHCGVCDENCGETEVCVEGACVDLPDDCESSGCPDGYVCDAGSCVDRCEQDPTATGCADRCGPCPAVANGSTGCVAGECQTVCDAGYEVCEEGCCGPPTAGRISGVNGPLTASSFALTQEPDGTPVIVLVEEPSNAVSLVRWTGSTWDVLSTGHVAKPSANADIEVYESIGQPAYAVAFVDGASGLAMRTTGRWTNLVPPRTLATESGEVVQVEVVDDEPIFVFEGGDRILALDAFRTSVVVDLNGSRRPKFDTGAGLHVGYQGADGTVGVSAFRRGDFSLSHAHSGFTFTARQGAFDVSSDSNRAVIGFIDNQTGELKFTSSSHGGSWQSPEVLNGSPSAVAPQFTDPFQIYYVTANGLHVANRSRQDGSWSHSHVVGGRITRFEVRGVHLVYADGTDVFYHRL